MLPGAFSSFFSAFVLLSSVSSLSFLTNGFALLVLTSIHFFIFSFFIFHFPTSSGLKALVTSMTAEGIESCRKACGGHGYSHFRSSYFPSIA